MKLRYIGLTISFILLLAACGGGGSSSTISGPAPIIPPPATQSETQTQFKTMFGLDGGGAYTPSIDYTLISPIRYADAHHYTLSGNSINESPTTLDEQMERLTTLTMGDYSGWHKVVIDGKLVDIRNDGVGNLTVQTSGANVQVNYLTLDKQSAFSIRDITTIEAIPVSGLLKDTPTEVTSMQNWGKLFVNQGSVFFKPGAAFLPGSTYFKVKMQEKKDFIVTAGYCLTLQNVNDPCPSDSPKTIEDVFTNKVGTGTWLLSDGTIHTINGVRAWVKTATTDDQSSLRYVFFELNQQVLYGVYGKTGTTVNYWTVTDNGTSNGITTYVDYNIYYNKAFMDSIKAGLDL